MIRAATTLLAVLAALAMTACGSSSKGDKGTFTDCATIGRLTTVTDPRFDQAGRVPGVAPEPQGDLVGVRLARANGRLCVEFQARGDIKPAAAYLLALRPRDAETPVVQLEATVFAAEAPRVLLNTGERGAAFRKVDADVGIKGDRISILVARDPFVHAGVEGVFDAFRFQARTAVITSDGGHLTDCAPSCS